METVLSVAWTLGQHVRTCSRVRRMLSHLRVDPSATAVVVAGGEPRALLAACLLLLTLREAHTRHHRDRHFSLLRRAATVAMACRHHIVTMENGSASQFCVDRLLAPTSRLLHSPLPPTHQQWSQLVSLAALGLQPWLHLEQSLRSKLWHPARCCSSASTVPSTSRAMVPKLTLQQVLQLGGTAASKSCAEEEWSVPVVISQQIGRVQRDWGQGRFQTTPEELEKFLVNYLQDAAAAKASMEAMEASWRRSSGIRKSGRSDSPKVPVWRRGQRSQPYLTLHPKHPPTSRSPLWRDLVPPRTAHSGHPLQVSALCFRLSWQLCHGIARFQDQATWLALQMRSSSVFADLCSLRVKNFKNAVLGDAVHDESALEDALGTQLRSLVSQCEGNGYLPHGWIHEMRLCSSRERESVQLLRQWKLHHLLGPQYTDPCIYSSEWVAHMMCAMRSRRAFLVAEATGTVTQLWPVFQKLSMETLHCEPVAPFVWKSLWLMDLFRSCWSSLPATCKRGVVLPNVMWVTLLYLGSGLLRYLRQWMPVCPLLHTLLQALVNELEKESVFPAWEQLDALQRALAHCRALTHQVRSCWELYVVVYSLVHSAPWLPDWPLPPVDLLEEWACRDEDPPSTFLQSVFDQEDHLVDFVDNVPAMGHSLEVPSQWGMEELCAEACLRLSSAEMESCSQLELACLEVVHRSTVGDLMDSYPPEDEWNSFCSSLSSAMTATFRDMSRDHSVVPLLDQVDALDHKYFDGMRSPLWHIAFPCRVWALHKLGGKKFTVGEGWPTPLQAGFLVSLVENCSQRAISSWKWSSEKEKSLKEDNPSPGMETCKRCLLGDACSFVHRQSPASLETLDEVEWFTREILRLISPDDCSSPSTPDLWPRICQVYEAFVERWVPFVVVMELEVPEGCEPPPEKGFMVHCSDGGTSLRAGMARIQHEATETVESIRKHEEEQLVALQTLLREKYPMRYRHKFAKFLQEQHSWLLSGIVGPTRLLWRRFLPVLHQVRDWYHAEVAWQLRLDEISQQLEQYEEEVAMCSGSFCSREVERFRQEAEKLIASERIQLQKTVTSGLSCMECDPTVEVLVEEHYIRALELAIGFHPWLPGDMPPCPVKPSEWWYEVRRALVLSKCQSGVDSKYLHQDTLGVWISWEGACDPSDSTGATLSRNVNLLADLPAKPLLLQRPGHLEGQQHPMVDVPVLTDAERIFGCLCHLITEKLVPVEQQAQVLARHTERAFSGMDFPAQLLSVFFPLWLVLLGNFEGPCAPSWTPEDVRSVMCKILHSQAAVCHPEQMDAVVDHFCAAMRGLQGLYSLRWVQEEWNHLWDLAEGAEEALMQMASRPADPSRGGVSGMVELQWFCQHGSRLGDVTPVAIPEEEVGNRRTTEGTHPPVDGIEDLGVEVDGRVAVGGTPSATGKNGPTDGEVRGGVDVDSLDAVELGKRAMGQWRRLAFSCEAPGPMDSATEFHLAQACLFARLWDLHGTAQLMPPCPAEGSAQWQHVASLLAESVALFSCILEQLGALFELVAHLKKLRGGSTSMEECAELVAWQSGLPLEACFLFSHRHHVLDGLSLLQYQCPEIHPLLRRTVIEESLLPISANCDSAPDVGSLLYDALCRFGESSG